MSNHIAEAEIYNLINFPEIIDIPCNYGSTYLSSQQRNTNITVASRIFRVEFTGKSEFLTCPANQNLGGRCWLN